MSIDLYFGNRVNPGNFERIRITSTSISNKVEELKTVISRKTNVPSELLEFVYCGNVLDNNATLESCGIKNDATIHILRKKEKEPPKKITPICEADILHLVSAFKNAMKNPHYRGALQRLSRPEVLENIIAATPGLAEDPIAVSIIQDPELLTQMCDANTVRRVVEAHPTLAEAAHYIVAVVHEEAASQAVSTNPSTSSGYSYMLDALSDDEEMDSSQSSDSQPRHGSGENIFASPITTAQLAAALASATGGTSNPVSESPSTNSVITTEMFNQAMQQAFANVTPSTPNSEPSRSASSGSDLADLEANSRRLNHSLWMMHQIGLTDDAINIQALQATDWNVEEAINLVLSEGMHDNDLR